MVIEADLNDIQNSDETTTTTFLPQWQLGFPKISYKQLDVIGHDFLKISLLNTIFYLVEAGYVGFSRTYLKTRFYRYLMRNEIF